MEHRYNVAQKSKNMVGDYFFLIQNLSIEDKIELIARISNSILKNKNRENAETKERILAETYGSFESSKTADELIDEIYHSRHFVDKNFEL